MMVLAAGFLSSFFPFVVPFRSLLFGLSVCAFFAGSKQDSIRKQNRGESEREKRQARKRRRKSCEDRAKDSKQRSGEGRTEWARKEKRRERCGKHRMKAAPQQRMAEGT